MLQSKVVIEVDGIKLIRLQERNETCIEVLYQNEKTLEADRPTEPAFTRYEKKQNQKGWFKETEVWYRNGMIHRDHKPAIITYSESGLPICEIWCQNDVKTKEIRYYENSNHKKFEAIYLPVNRVKKTVYLFSGKIMTKWVENAHKSLEILQSVIP